MSIEIPDEAKIFIIEQNRQKWANTLYDAELDAKIAEKLGDERLREQAAQRMKNALKALDVLEGILGELAPVGESDS